MKLKKVLEALRDDFEEKIGAKNSWGKNEVRDLFMECLTDVIIDILNDDERV